MSTHHKNLAEVWQHLQGRHDLAIILREVIGQHSIETTLQDNEAQNSEESIRAIIWIKAVFDLQRAYLSGNCSGIADCPPYVLSCLLPPELLFSTILYLVNVKTRSFPSQTTLLTKEFTRPRYILAQTVLSGLRLLLLRKEEIAAHDKKRLRVAINAAWQNDRLHGVDRFVVSELFAGILDSEMSRENAYIQEWDNARLPNYAAGLYPLEIRPETFVPSLLNGTMEEAWIDAYLILFDCIWAIESALTQRYVDLRRQCDILGSNHYDVDTDETLEQLYHTRTSLIISLFHVKGPMNPPPGLMESLASTLLDWDDDLDSFLSRQDSLLQRSATRPVLLRTGSHGRLVHEIGPYLESSLNSFSQWLAKRKSGYEQFSIRRAGVTATDMEEMVREWIARMASLNVETHAPELEGPLLPTYIVNCPKLHVIPKKHLEYKLRWCDKWACESIQENSPIVSWKEGVSCPSCSSGGKINYARIIEPFQHLSMALETFHFDDYSLSQYSVGDSGSYDTASASGISHNSSSGAESLAMSLPSQATMSARSLSHISTASESKSLSEQPPSYHPNYSESPISPASLPPLSRGLSTSPAIECPVSPLNQSLNIPIPIASRMSMDLPIPVYTPNNPESTLEAVSSRSAASSIRLNTPSTDSMMSGGSIAKSKSPSRTVRIANSMRRRPTKEKEAYPLPKVPTFVFSASGHSLLLWEKSADNLVRFDIPSNDASAIQGCKYEVPKVEAAAAGNHRCAIIASKGSGKRKLVVYDGINLSPEHETELEVSSRFSGICLAVSRNDKFTAASMGDQIFIYRLDDGIKLMAFHHQIQVFELRGGVSHRRTINVGRNQNEDLVAEQFKNAGWFGEQRKGLSSKEVAEEQQRQGAVVSRKLYFSTDSKQLVVATQLGDHCVYVDVWDVSREPVSTISEHSRSFKMPPFTLNDGDLASVFYDTMRRSAIVTAFLGKEYPLLIPFPGYEPLQNEQYSTKVVHAAQSPSGLTFTVVNAMTEIIQFEYTAKGGLSPRKLKKASSKISTSVFKPGTIALAMPLESILQCFWIKDGKCMLRTIRIGAGETFKDYDIRPHYDRLMSLKSNPVIARAPTLRIPELGTGDIHG
ncbi:hypothetical protein BCR34DRAFT_583230 [Clohesyomyces aquaticus]|uniref:Uncharacterized protein n=1 Tax=Clohesyomyces aquaticus TaxID=1231657 RepID=A0A1Y2A615_9PLEO|nr:hypothetical protein BCR34DRAFT_583230 [Clohesyomyces aquaticus]